MKTIQSILNKIKVQKWIAQNNHVYDAKTGYIVNIQKETHEAISLLPDLIKQRDELLEALKPFAKLALHFKGDIGLRPKEGVIHQWSDKHGEHDLTVEMLKQSEAILNKIETFNNTPLQ